MTDKPKIQELVNPDATAPRELLEQYLARAEEFDGVIILASRKDGHPEHCASRGMWNSRITWLCMCLQKWIQNEVI